MSSVRQVYLPYKQTPTLYTVIRIEVLESGIVGALVDPNNAPRYDTCEGLIKTGLVREIRNYVYNVSIPGFNPGFTNVTSFVKDTGSSDTVYTYTVNSNFTISKRRPIAIRPDPPSNDPYLRQEEYFQRDLFGNLVYETYNATGIEYIPVFGSWDRALSAARDIVLPNDYFIGDYVTYHYNGYPAKTYSFVRLSGQSVLHGNYFEYYNNGVTRVEGKFINGYLSDFYREYFYDGTVKCQATLLNGKLNGEYTQWDALGNRLFRAYYINGTLNNSYALVYSVY